MVALMDTDAGENGVEAKTEEGSGAIESLHPGFQFFFKDLKKKNLKDFSPI